MTGSHNLLHTDKIKRGFRNFVRDVPGTIDVWIDNMTDQSHVAYAHNGAIFPKYASLKTVSGGWCHAADCLKD